MISRNWKKRCNNAIKVQLSQTDVDAASILRGDARKISKKQAIRNKRIETLEMIIRKRMMPLNYAGELPIVTCRIPCFILTKVFVAGVFMGIFNVEIFTLG